jgi:hypothetical protein
MKDIPRQHIIRIIKTRNRGWAQHIGRMGENRKAYKDFVGKKERIERHRHRWQNIIKIDLKLIECGFVQH